MKLPEHCIVFDTETTGLDPDEGHRVIELACVELVDLLPSGREFYALIDPCRPIPMESTRIHGRSDADVQGKPRFEEIATSFSDFVGDLPLVAHNAPFDVKFMNSEMARAGFQAISNPVVDSLTVARSQFGGANTLDALCNRFGIDLSKRGKHDAMLDTRLLARVYLHLLGGPHRRLDLSAGQTRKVSFDAPAPDRTWPARDIGRATAQEIEAHAGFMPKVKKPIWDDHPAWSSVDRAAATER